MVPPDLFLPILNLLSVEYVLEHGKPYVDCSSKENLSDIKLMFAGHWLTLNPDDYFHDVEGRICTLLITANAYDFFILGAPIF